MASRQRICTEAQGRIFNAFLGVSEVAMQKCFVCDLFSSYNGSPMFLCPVSCPAEVYCTTVFVLRDGKFSRLEEVTQTPIAP